MSERGQVGKHLCSLTWARMFIICLPGRPPRPCLAVHLDLQNVIRRLTQQLYLKQHALGLLEDRMAGSESAQLAATVDQVRMRGVEDICGSCISLNCIGIVSYERSSEMSVTPPTAAPRL